MKLGKGGMVFMFNLWTESEKLDVFSTKKNQTYKFGVDQEFQKQVYDITFKLKSRQKKDQMYLNFYPQSQLKLSYEIQNLLKGKTASVEKSFARKDDDGRVVQLKIEKTDKDFLIYLCDSKNGDKSIPISSQDLFILYEYLHDQSLDLMLKDVMDLTIQKNTIPEFGNESDSKLEEEIF